MQLPGADALVAVDARPDRHQPDPTAASPRKASEVASARVDVAESCEQPGQARGHLFLGAVDLGRDLGIRPALGQQLQQPALDLVDAAQDRRRSRIRARRSPRRSRPSVRRARRSRVRRGRSATRRGSSRRAVPWAIRDSTSWRYARITAVRLRRAARQDRPGRGNDDLEAGVLVERRPAMPRAAAPPAIAAVGGRRGRARPRTTRRPPARPTERVRAGAAAAPSPVPPIARRARRGASRTHSPG